MERPDARRFAGCFPRRLLTGALCHAAIVVLLAGGCDQQDTPPKPPPSFEGSIGHVILNAASLERAAFAFGDGAKPGDGAIAIEPVDDGAEQGRGLRLLTRSQAASLDSLEATLPISSAVASGESCWLHMNARALETQRQTNLARLALAFRATERRQRRAFAHDIYLDRTWSSVDLPFKANGAFGAGEAGLVLGFGSRPQTIEIGDVMIRCFSPDVALDRLPRTAFSYEGRQADAPWRAAAESRIERYRKGDLLVQVVDSEGNPVQGADIRVQMTRHRFNFGTAVDAELVAGVSAGGGPSQYSGEQTAIYRRLLSEMFNTASIERSMTWIPWSDSAQRRVTEDALAWIDSLNLRLRGGHLISPSIADLPRPLQAQQNDPEVIRAAAQQRVEEMVSALGDKVDIWDVVDRPRENRDLLDLLGEDVIDDWFEAARAAADEPQLALNEDEALNGDHLPALAELVVGLQERDVPIDSLGVAVAISLQPPSIQVLDSQLDSLSSLGLPLAITGFEMDTTDEALQADFTRDLMTLAFSKPSVEGLILAGFWEGRQDVTSSAMYREDFTIKPNGEVYRDLVLDTWWTDKVAQTNQDGSVVLRGFLGDYSVTARLGDRAATSTIALGLDGANLKITLPP